MYLIYKLTNLINNKLYFGYTSQHLTTRFYGHYNETRDTIISRSIRKYGKENFAREIIHQTDDINEAKKLEQFLIETHQTNTIRYPNGIGMNMTDGGEGASGFKHSTEQRRIWSQVRKGKNTGKDHPRYGCTGLANNISKKVFQFTTDGTCIACYFSAKCAGEVLNVDPSNISRCCRNKLNTVHNYIFQYTPVFSRRDLNPNYTKRFGSQNHRSHLVYLFDNKQHKIATFESVGEAARYLSLPYRTVLAATKSKSKFLGDNYISYHDQITNTPRRSNKRSNYTVQQIDPHTFNIINTHESVNAASKITGINRGSIHTCLCGKSKTAGGFSWKKLTT